VSNFLFSGLSPDWGTEHHDFTSKFINSESPTTRKLATLLYTSPSGGIIQRAPTSFRDAPSERIHHTAKLCNVLYLTV
jgi:hypothetical protein